MHMHLKYVLQQFQKSKHINDQFCHNQSIFLMKKINVSVKICVQLNIKNISAILEIQKQKQKSILSLLQ